MSHPNPYDGSKPLKDSRRESFCQEAIARNDINSAYEMAGFKRPRGNAYRMTREPNVEKRLAFLWKSAATRAELMAGRWLVKADLIANANMMDFWETDPETGEPLRLKLGKLPHACGGAIQEISFDSNGRPKLRLYGADDMLKFLIERADPSVRKVAMTDPTGREAAQPFVVEIVKFSDVQSAPHQATA